MKDKDNNCQNVVIAGAGGLAARRLIMKQLIYAPKLMKNFSKIKIGCLRKKNYISTKCLIPCVILLS
jgi:hypothetical protein